MNNKLEFIELMLECEVLKFGSFITKSGRISPYFINTGNFNTGYSINKLASFYSNIINSNFPNATVLFGPAYKGISLVVASSMNLYSQYKKNINYCYNRKEVKDHGEGGNIVGYKLKDNDRIVILEDVITAGTSINETVPLLYKECKNIKIEGLIVAVDRMEKSQEGNNSLLELSQKYNLKITSIINIKEIIDLLHNKKINNTIYIDDEKKALIIDYLNKYSSLNIG